MSPAPVEFRSLAGVDYLVIAVYFGFVLGVGWLVRRSVHTSKDFFEAGRRTPAWGAGLAFVSANLGAQEGIGMGASGAKDGIATAPFYWGGALPGMGFVPPFLVPVYHRPR